MKYLLSAISLVYTLSPAIAQSYEKDSSGDLLSTYTPITVKLVDPQKEHPESCSFHHFEVIDERPDTLRIGAHTGAGLFGKGNRQLVLASRASVDLGNYLDARLARSSSPYTALVVIRALWLSDGTYTLAELSKDTAGISQIKTKIRLKAEIYAEKAGVYIPLFRFDSTRMSRTRNYFMTGQDLAGMLNALADSAGIVLSKKGDGGRKLTLDDICRFNQSRYSAVIYNDSVLMVKGVYRDFQEFRDNAPSIQNFETIDHKGKLLLYLKEDGGSYYSRDAWGYCDGKNIYVMKDGMLVPAWKEGKAFYLLGQPEEDALGKPQASQGGSVMVPVGSASGSGGMVSGTEFVGVGISPGQNKPGKTAALKHIFTVDMDTGKLY
jgi:hypothetical protein